MKIVEIIPTLSSGGAERFTVDLCNELSKKHEVTLIVLDSLERSGFYAVEISSEVNVISITRKSRIDFSILFSLRKIILEINPDVVHTHIRAIIFSLWTILTTKGIRYFHTVHNDAQKEAKGAVFGAIRRYLFRKKLVIPITISKESQQSFIDYYNCSAPIIFNGRDIPEHLECSGELKDEFRIYRKDSNARVLVCLARITPVKRQGMLAKIAARLNLDGYKFTLLLIGNATRYPDIVDEIKQYNAPNIHILGEKQNPLEYLKLSDAFCLCSLYEGMPISLIEAMGVGAIPICTQVGGIVDVIVNDKNGLLSDDLSEVSYYNTLKKFLSLPESELCKLKKETLRSYAPFSMQECAESYIRLFSNHVINNCK